LLRNLAAALLGLGLAATIGSVARADAPPPPVASAASPGAKALLAGEEAALGTTAPDIADFVGKDLLGKPIRRIDVVTVGERWRGTIPITSVKTGELASLGAARRLMREALATGKLARANVEAFEEDGGVVLRLNVLPRRLIASVQVKGGTLDTGETLESAGVATDGELTTPRLDEIKAKVRKHYEQHGFPSAEVLVDTADTDQPDKVILSIEVKPGAARTIAQRVFVIDPSANHEVGGLKEDYKVSRGDRANEVALAEADRELGESLRQHGFFRAEVRHLLRTTGPNTFLYVYVLAGPRFVPLFDGNHAFDAVDLEEALNLVKQPEARQNELVDRLHTFYVARGFLDAEVRMTEKGKPEDALHWLAFTVREHAQVRVTRRVFPCLTGDMTPDDVGREIGSFLEEDLPGAESFGPVNPRAVDRLFGPTSHTGKRGLPADLNPQRTYAPATYERAVKHVRDLLHSKGYLNAVVGPVSVVRATCGPRSPAGGCIPVVPKVPLQARCLKDAVGLPVPEPAVPEAYQCRPDPLHDVTCSTEMTVRIPIAPGPQTTLYDLAFEGNKSQTSADLAKVANLPLGTPLSGVELEAARQRVLDAYRGRGFAYADVRAEPEPSPDRTRARVRFYVTEREPVIVTGFVVKGAKNTSQSLILGRVALKKDKEFRLEWARATEARIATLGTFSSVTVALEDADVPEKRKRVVITVVEQKATTIGGSLGFSTGDGIRGVFEYGHRNLGGQAISMTLRLQLSYLPDALILDPAVLVNYQKLDVVHRLERRDTLAFTFPEVGLGPLVSFSVELLDVNDNQRDYGIDKEAIVPTFTYRPFRQLMTQFGGSVEYNNVDIFNAANAASTFGLIRAPKGESVAGAGRIAFTTDTRDKPLDATKGVLFATSAEYVHATPLGQPDPIPSNFLRLTGRFAFYLSKWGITLAASVGAGGNIQLTNQSQTYPDRLFFMGGVDTHRAFLADSLVPQDLADRIKSVSTPEGHDSNSGLPTGQRNPNAQAGLPLAQRSLTVADITLRGGDLMINPRVELRVPLISPFMAGIFLDTGNIWLDPTAIRFDADLLRYGAGAGLRVVTPIGQVAFDYGFNLNRRPWEDVGAFHFSIGLF
jgi:outer membrane protein assembly factor BamA